MRQIVDIDVPIPLSSTAMSAPGDGQARQDVHREGSCIPLCGGEPLGVDIDRQHRLGADPALRFLTGEALSSTPPSIFYVAWSLAARHARGSSRIGLREFEELPFGPATGAVGARRPR